jgi:Flp pilus assembly protein TadD
MGPHFHRGQTLFELSKFEDAIKAYREELSVNPDSAIVYAVMSAAFVNLRRIREADQSNRRALELAPNLSYAHYIRSYIRQHQGRAGAAEKAVEEAIRLECLPRYFCRWGEFSFQRHHFRECLERTEQALAIHPQHPGALMLRAKALAATGRLREAKEAAHQVLRVDPNSPEAHYQLGSLNLQAGTTPQALGPLLEARRLNPVVFNDRDAIAGAYGRLLWPFRLIDAYAVRFGAWSPVRRWLFLATLATALLAIAYLRLPPKLLAMPAFIIVFNALALPYSNDLLSIAFGKFAFRKDLDIAWYKLIPELIRVAFPLVIHSLLTAVAIFSAGSPIAATIVLAFIPNFELLVKLVRDWEDFVSMVLWGVMIFGVFTPIIFAVTFLDDGYQVLQAAMCWSVALVSSFVISLRRK